jgi:hypothetical protein
MEPNLERISLSLDAVSEIVAEVLFDATPSLDESEDYNVPNITPAMRELSRISERSERTSTDSVTNSSGVDGLVSDKMNGHNGVVSFRYKQPKVETISSEIENKQPFDDTSGFHDTNRSIDT